MKVVPVLLGAIGLGLAACGGGNGGTLPVASMTPQIPDISREGALTADPGAGRNAAGAAAQSLPRFGSVTQSTARGVSGISSDAASTTFNGSNVAVTITRENSSAIALNTTKNALSGAVQTSPLSGHDYKDWYILEAGARGATIAYTAVTWDNDDPTYYLAGGYWFHVAGDLQSGIVTGAEVGAFVDGPEIAMSNPPNMPVSGQAKYSGPAGGVYSAHYGTDSAAATGYAVGSLELGEFASRVDLVADFANAAISGCVGCQGGVTANGAIVSPGGDLLESFSDVNVPIRTRLGSTPFNASGEFRGRNVSIESSYTFVSSSSGAWGGKFSNIPDTEGEPRLVAGTFGGEGNTLGGSELVFIGAFFAPKQ